MYLWKVDDDWLPVVRDHDVELVEVAVNDSVIGKLQQQVHQLGVQLTSIVNLQICKTKLLCDQNICTTTTTTTTK